MKKTATLIKGCFAAFLFTLITTLSFAQGNTCVTAAELDVSGTYNANGASDGNGCFNCTGATHADWYYFTAPKNGSISISACGRGLNASDSRLWVYSGSCESLSQVAANDDACGLTGGYAAAINNVSVTAGNTYYLEWDDRWDDRAFEFDFQFTPECNNPTNIAFSQVTNNSFVVNWTSTNDGADFILEYGALGFIPGNGTEIEGVVGIDNPVAISGLNAGTTYAVYVQEDCGLNTQTNNVGPFTQTTKFSAPPVNDLCAAASPIFCGQTYTGSIINATETGNPSGTCGTSSTSPGVWFKFTGSGDRITLSLCNSNYNTRMMVYAGVCEDYICVTGNDNSSDCALNRSKVSVNTNNGTSYLVFVSGANGLTGNYSLLVSCDAACAAPANDDCSNPTSLVIAPQTECEVTAGTNVCATLAKSPNECELSLGIADVWYSFNTGALTDVIMSVDLLGADQLKYALYDACGNEALSCGTVNLLTSEVLTDLTMNTDYLLQIWNGGGDEAGAFEICLSAPIGSSVNERTEDKLVVSVFPNPTQGNLVNVQGEGDLEIAIFAIDGKQVFKTTIVNQGQLNLTGLNNGVYFVEVKQEQKTNIIRLVKD